MLTNLKYIHVYIQVVYIYIDSKLAYMGNKDLNKQERHFFQTSLFSFKNTALELKIDISFTKNRYFSISMLSLLSHACACKAG